jgi:hypothetical protein
MYIIWKKFPRCQGYIKRLDFIYYNNIVLYIYSYHSYHAKKTGGTKLISTIGSLHIGPFILHTVLFNWWCRVVLCTVKNLLLFGSNSWNWIGYLVSLRVYLGLLRSTFHISAPTLSTRHFQLLKFRSPKKVEFKANSTFFLEHLKRYSRNPIFESTRGVLIVTYPLPLVTHVPVRLYFLLLSERLLPPVLPPASAPAGWPDPPSLPPSLCVWMRTRGSNSPPHLKLGWRVETDLWRQADIGGDITSGGGVELRRGQEMVGDVRGGVRAPRDEHNGCPYLIH